MSTKLHQILAVEKTRVGQAQKLQEDTLKKFGKATEYFFGHNKTLQLITENEQNEAIQAQAEEDKPVTTTVYETLEYFLERWARAEDVSYQKTCANQNASADVIFRGTVLLAAVPVEELLNLETRLTELRKVFVAVPTLNSNVAWIPAGYGQYVWRAAKDEVTTKTEKTTFGIILAPATDKHPAQVERGTKDEVVGRFTRIIYSGAAQSVQKANALEALDDLLVAIKQARMTANTVEVTNDTIGDKITALLLSNFQ